VLRAAFADFDVLLLDPDGDEQAIELLPARVHAACGKWRANGWVAACVHDRPTARAAVVGHAAQLQRAGARLLWVSSAGDATMAGARLPAAPLADRLRNELGIATAIVTSLSGPPLAAPADPARSIYDTGTGDALLPDLDAAIAAGRSDLVVVAHVPASARTRGAP
jgi:hypothetical protein